MNRPRQDATPSRPRLRLNIWLIGVLTASSVALTAWALYSRADAPRAAAPTVVGPSYNFLGFADLEDGLTPLFPLQPGRVTQVFVHDGDAVEKDAPLFKMDDTTAQADKDAAEADLGDAQLQLELAHKLESQRQQQLEAQRQVVEARKGEAAAAHAKADQARRLSRGETHAVSDEDARAADDQAKALDAVARGEEAKLRMLDLEDPTIAVRRAEKLVDGKKAQLRKAEEAVRECTVWAPKKGVVERIQVTEGVALGAMSHDPAVMFAGEGERIVRAEVEQEWGGQVGVDAPVTVHDYSVPSLIWHGKVKHVSDWYSHRRSMLLEPLQLNDVRTLECIITLNPDDLLKTPLRIGQRVRVAIGG